MPSTEVQRTLVKSPPELWAEVSDPAALARHLGELGEIHLTRVEPESAVEWEAQDVKGSVQLKASGWGTKVTFSLTRELPEPAAQEVEPATAEATETAHVESEQEYVASESEAEPDQPPSAMREPAPPAPAKPEPMTEPEPTPRRGFFARLFRRRRAEPAVEIAEHVATTPESVAAFESVVEVAEIPEPVTGLAEPQAPEPAVADSMDDPAGAPTPEDTQEPPGEAIVEPADLAAELAAMEQTMTEQDTALLTAVLDRLGAAHHRPFSHG